MSKYFEVEDDVQNICLDCHHIGFTHAEHEIEGQEEAEVVCPKCHSTYYFVISEEEKAIWTMTSKYFSEQKEKQNA
jgi:Zn finger protein HypA/HybF involved in hydrogenase expression